MNGAHVEHIWDLGFDDRLTLKSDTHKIDSTSTTELFGVLFINTGKSLWKRKLLEWELTAEDPEFDKSVIVESSLKIMQNVKSKSNEADYGGLVFSH